MRQPNRAERRLAAKRMKAKAKEKLKAWGYKDDSLTDRMIGKHADNMAICSCDMCGNPRKVWGKKTIQERRFESRFRSSAV